MNLTHLSRFLTPSVRQFREAQRVRLNYSAIARRLGVSPQHVRRVALGLGTSARVMKALDRELRKVQNSERAA